MNTSDQRNNQRPAAGQRFSDRAVTSANQPAQLGAGEAATNHQFNNDELTGFVPPSERGKLLYDRESGAVLLFYQHELGERVVTIPNSNTQGQQVLHFIKLAASGRLPAQPPLKILPMSNRELVDAALATGYKVTRLPSPRRRGAPLTNREKLEQKSRESEEAIKDLLDLV